MSHPLAAWMNQLRSVFAKETLPPPPDHSPPRRGGPGVASLLFAIEPLPFEPERPRARSGRGPLSLLFSPEPLPLDPERAPERRRRWLAWLFLPERLDSGTDSPEVH